MTTVHSFSRSHRLLTLPMFLSDFLYNQTKILVLVFPRVLDLTHIYITWPWFYFLYNLCFCDVCRCVTQSCLRPVKQAQLAALVWQGAGIQNNKGSRLFLRRGCDTQPVFFHRMSEQTEAIFLVSRTVILFCHCRKDNLKHSLCFKVYLYQKKSVKASIKSFWWHIWQGEWDTDVRDVKW